MKALLALGLALLLAACQPDSSPTAAAAQPKLVDKAHIDQVLSSLVHEQGLVGVSALIYEQGEEAYFGAFGFADREAQQAMERNTLARLYSMTKPITGVALMMLYEEGRFQLDDPLAKYLPEYAHSTPDTVWDHYGLTPDQAARGGMNPQMFNSFLDGTKSALEMAAISNASGLIAPRDGLLFPPAGAHDLANILKPRAHGGVLEQAGMVEVVSSLERDGRQVTGDLRWGVYVTFRAGDAVGEDYVRRCFREYGFSTDASGRYSAMYKPYHAIGLELGISVASAGLRGEPTGQAVAWHGDVVATAKRGLTAGETLDGEGGYTVYGKLYPAHASCTLGGLPLGLAHGVTLKRSITANAPVRRDDVEYDADDDAVRVRREMETTFAIPDAKHANSA